MSIWLGLFVNVAAVIVIGVGLGYFMDMFMDLFVRAKYKTFEGKKAEKFVRRFLPFALGWLVAAELGLVIFRVVPNHNLWIAPLWADYATVGLLIAAVSEKFKK